MSVNVFGQTNSKTHDIDDKDYPYFQASPGGKLETVFNMEQEKKLRFNALLIRDKEKFLDSLQKEVVKRDGVIVKQDNIIKDYDKQLRETEKQKNILSDKIDIYFGKTQELNDNIDQLQLKLEQEKTTKNKWKYRFYTISSIVTTGIITAILLK